MEERLFLCGARGTLGVRVETPCLGGMDVSVRIPKSKEPNTKPWK